MNDHVDHLSHCVSALATDEARKIDRFMVGWNTHAEDLIMPDSKYDEKLDRFVTWKEVVAGLTLFECRAAGERFGREYADSVGGK